MLAALDEQLTYTDEDGDALLAVALLATVYVEEPSRREVREAIVSCCEDYLARCGQQILWAYNPDTDRMERFREGKGSNPQAWLPLLSEDEHFMLLYHGAAWDRGASALSLQSFGPQRYPYPQLGHFRVSFPVLWFSMHPGSLTEVLLEICRKLKPVSGYGGIGMVMSPDRAIYTRTEPIVYELAQRFPGLEIDYLVEHGIWLANEKTGGIKGVNWLTVVGEPWLAKLGGADALEADLAALDRRFIVHRFPGGVMIQAGPHPMLGDAQSNDWPDLYVKLARKLRPIRVAKHGPMQLAGPGLRMDTTEPSEAWLRRFDDR
jgi:hypothetical protein